MRRRGRPKPQQLLSLGEPRLRRLRALLAEYVGTLLLTFVAAGGAVIAALSGGRPDEVAQTVAPGLLVMTMIYTIGPTSGAHLNPVVTLSFALRGDFTWRRVPEYVLLQFLGAISAALLLRAMFSTAGHLGATLPHHGSGTSLVLEAVLTFTLVTVILATAANDKIVGHNAAIAVGGVIVLDGLFAAPISGASMNPARSLGPALVSQNLHSVWIYVAGPTFGAVVAVVVAWLLRGPGSPQAKQAAMGEVD